MNKDIIIASSGKELVFSGKNGAILSFKRNGTEHLKPAKDLFSAILTDGKKIRSGKFRTFSFKNNIFTFKNHPDRPGAEVKISIRAVQGRFYFRFEIKKLEIRKLDPLILICADGGEVLWSASEGALDGDDINRNPRVTTNHYPGLFQMQFTTHLYKDGGVYFSALDPDHSPKIPCFFADRNKDLHLSIETFGAPDYEFMLTAFDGDWMDAAEIYREYVENSGQLKKRKLPEWLEKSPVMLVIPILFDDGKICDRFFPYRNIIPYIKQYSDALDSNVLALIMKHDHNGQWLPPYIWPPRGGEECFAELTDWMHENGHYIGIYGSGADWTQKSLTSNYSGVSEFRKKNLAEVVTRKENGKMDFFKLAGLRNGYHLCITEPFTRNVLKDQVRAVAKANIDFFQLFDQDLGGNVHDCYAKNHNHPPCPSKVNTKSFSDLLSELLQEIESVGSKMLLGTECAAAEPFIHQLQLNELRPQFVFQGRVVPLYQYVFHQYTCNSMGNQCVFQNHIDLEKSPDNFLWRIGYFFNAGELLSCNLGTDGKISSAAGYNGPEYGNDEQSLELIRNLNKFRRKYPEFLVYGKMLKPLRKVKTGTWRLHRKNGTYTDWNSVFCSSWEADNGETATFLTNFLPEKQTVEVDGKKLEIPPLNAVRI